MYVASQLKLSTVGFQEIVVIDVVGKGMVDRKIFQKLSVDTFNPCSCPAALFLNLDSSDNQDNALK